MHTAQASTAPLPWACFEHPLVCQSWAYSSWSQTGVQATPLHVHWWATLPPLDWWLSVSFSIAVINTWEHRLKREKVCLPLVHGFLAPLPLGEWWGRTWFMGSREMLILGQQEVGLRDKIHPSKYTPNDLPSTRPCLRTHWWRLHPHEPLTS
jgi:hypothetical protein